MPFPCLWQEFYGQNGEKSNREMDIGFVTGNKNAY